MKVVHFNAVDNVGGAAKVARRLHMHMNIHMEGVESRYVVKNKTVDDSTIERLCGAKRHMESVITKKFISSRRTSLTNSLFSFSFIGEPGIGGLGLEDIDIIHLHWVENFIDLRNIGELLSYKKPVFWTIHDEKPYTGGCHCTFDCNGFQGGCMGCSQLEPESHELVEMVQKDKVDFFSCHNDIRLIAPSSWIKSQLEKSAVFKNYDVKVIPHGVDESIFNADDREIAKGRLGLTASDLVITFSANNCSATHKGFSYFLEAMHRCAEDYDFSELCRQRKVVLLIVGENVHLDNLAMPVKVVGYVQDELEMSLLYQASDILVNPTLADSFSLVSLEAMACGCVVAGFRTGGLVDFVVDDTGRLVERRDSAALARVIVDLATDKKILRRLSDNGVQKVKKEYTVAKQALRYIEYYSQYASGDCKGDVPIYKSRVDKFVSANTARYSVNVGFLFMVRSIIMMVVDRLPMAYVIKSYLKKHMF